MKNMKKLIPALAMLVLSAVMMSTASFAWFSMNTQVAVDGINVTTVAPVYLSVRPVGGDSDDWGISVEESYDNIVLIPADTDKNLTAWYVIDPDSFKTDAGGGTLADATEAVTENDLLDHADGKVTTPESNFKDNYIYLKLSYEFALQNEVAKDIYLYLASMTINPISDKMVACLRVAVVNVTEGNSVVGIYAVEDDTHKALTDELTEGEAVPAIGGTTSGNTVTYEYSADNDVELPVVDEFVQIDIYIWFEGQDEDCVNANVDGNFDISFIFAAYEEV